MKTYYIANARMPNEKAHGIQIAKMCEVMVEEGFDLELIVPRRKTHKESVQKFHFLRTNIKTTYLPVIDLYLKGRLLFFLSSLTFMISYFFYLSFKKIKGEKFLIYTIDIENYSGFFIPLIGVPYFSEMHGGKPKNIFSSFFFKRISGVITINQIIKDELCSKFGVSPKQIIVEPNGVDLLLFKDIDKVKSRRQLNIPDKRKMVLYIGRFYKWKGLEVISKCSGFLSKDVYVYLVGGSKEEFVKLTGISEIPENIMFLGPRDYKEMPIWMSAADTLLVLGTKKDLQSYSYTSPMKLFEYMATFRPIISSDTPALKQILDTSCALFYHHDNPNDLAKVINNFFVNINAFNDLGFNAYNKVKYYTWNNRAKRVKNFIQQS